MTRSLAILALAAAALTAGCASSNSSPIWRSAGLDPSNRTELMALEPTLVRTETGTRVHGMVCRAPATVATRPGKLRLRYLNAARQEVGATTVWLATSLNHRNRACDAYDVQTSWMATSSETVSVTASD